MTDTTKKRGPTDLFPLRHIDGVHRAGADLTFLVLEKQHAGLKLRVLIVPVQDVDGDADAGVVVLSCVHFLSKRT